MAIERDRFDEVTPAPAPTTGRRYKHNQRPYIDALASCPMQYRATLAGTENGKRIEVTGGLRRTEGEAVADAWEALRAWAMAGKEEA